MDSIEHIIRNIPFFRHCTQAEISLLRRKGRMVSIPRGQRLDLLRINSLNLVAKGLFEIEARGKNDVVYFSAGSFFGDIPFTEAGHHGTVRACVDSQIMLFDIDEMYRFFLTSYKASRGYLRIIDKMGLEISPRARRYSSNRTRIVAVCGPQADSGKTTLASLLACACARKGKTIVLDLSYQGNSVFNHFEKKITAALSQKHDDAAFSEEYVGGMIERVDENLSLLNVCFGSKLRVDPEILSPLLFLLSREYRYVIMDISPQDERLRDRALGLCDVVFATLRRARDREELYGLFDAALVEGQRVYYTLNRFYDRGARSFEGGMILDELALKKGEGSYPRLLELAESGGEAFSRLVTEKRNGLVCETLLLESALYSGLLSTMFGAGISIDLMYSSSISFLVAALFLLFEDTAELDAAMARLFADDRINSLLDITFPEEHVIKNSKIHKFAREAARNKRAEIFKCLPVVLLADERNHSTRLFSTGYLADLMAASFLLYPVFESLPIAGGLFHSGYPRTRVKAEDLLRTDIDEIYYAAVMNRQTMNGGGTRILRFYSRYLEYLQEWKPEERISEAFEKNIVLEIDEKEFNIMKLLRLSRELSEGLLKGKKL